VSNVSKTGTASTTGAGTSGPGIVIDVPAHFFIADRRRRYTHYKDIPSSEETRLITVR
jgi:hypothetical protein